MFNLRNVPTTYLRRIDHHLNANFRAHKIRNYSSLKDVNPEAQRTNAAYCINVSSD